MTEYKLNLFIRSERVLLNTLLGGFALLVVGFGVMLGLRDFNVDAAFIAGMLIIFGVGYMGHRAYKKAVIVPSLVSVAATELSVRDLRQDCVMLAVKYEDIASYRYLSFGGAEEFRITLHNTRRLFIKAKAQLAEVGDFAGMVADFEHRLAAFADAATPLPVGEHATAAEPGRRARREKSFFEKPVSTVGLLVFTATLAFTIKQVATGALPMKGNFVLVGGSYLSYLAAWLAAAKQRKQP
jgi:hypothetical protein